MLKFYKKSENWKYKKISYFGGIYKVYYNYLHKKEYLLGFLVKERFFYENIYNNVLPNNNMNYAVARQHSKVFPQFKNINKGKAGVIVATGPTMLYYKKKDLVHFVVNDAFIKVQPDYWFAIDARNNSKYYDQLAETDFVKFYGQCIASDKIHCYKALDNSVTYHIPDCVIENSKNAHKFYFNHPDYEINRDIETQCLPDFGSVVFSALYFAIYSGCKKIYLVGCDCSCNGYFDRKEHNDDWIKGNVVETLLNSWKVFKRFIEVYYPDVEVISINPVGLKRLFKDVYTQEYLDANPHILEELAGNITILENM